MSTNEKTFSLLLKEAWNVYTNNFAFFLTLVVVFTLPFELITVLTLPETSFFADFDAPISTGPLAVVGNISLILGMVASIILAAAVIVGTHRAMNGKSIDFKQILQESRPYWWPLFGTMIIFAALLILLTLALIIPAIVFGVYWTFVLPIVVLGNKRFYAALKESKRLVRGRWWQVFGNFFMIFLMMIPIALILFIPTAPLVQAVPWLEAVITTLLNIAITFITVFSVVYYIDLIKQTPAEESASSDSTTVKAAEPKATV